MFKIKAYNIGLPKIQTNGVHLSEYIKFDDRKRLYFNLNIGILQKGKKISAWILLILIQTDFMM